MNPPSTAVSILLGIVAIPSMLAADWMLVPQIIGLFWEIERLGPFYVATSADQLVADLILCFIFASALMYVVQLRAKPHGVAIAACIAFASWAVYFTEVGFFKGMLHSQYPLWYEIISFIKYPSALGLSFFLRQRAQATLQADGPSFGGPAA